MTNDTKRDLSGLSREELEWELRVAWSRLNLRQSTAELQESLIVLLHEEVQTLRKTSHQHLLP